MHIKITSIQFYNIKRNNQLRFIALIRLVNAEISSLLNPDKSTVCFGSTPKRISVDTLNIDAIDIRIS